MNITNATMAPPSLPANVPPVPRADMLRDEDRPARGAGENGDSNAREVVVVCQSSLVLDVRIASEIEIVVWSSCSDGTVPDWWPGAPVRPSVIGQKHQPSVELITQHTTGK